MADMRTNMSEDMTFRGRVRKSASGRERPICSATSSCAFSSEYWASQKRTSSIAHLAAARVRGCAEKLVVPLGQKPRDRSRCVAASTAAARKRRVVLREPLRAGRARKRDHRFRTGESSRPNE